MHGALFNLPKLFVKQKKELAEIIIDFETCNKYAVCDETGREIGYIAEEGGGVLQWVKRFILRSHRPLQVTVFDETRQPVLRFHRPFFFFFSDLFVDTADGRRVGSVHRRFGILYKKYDVREASGALFAHVRSALWRIWTFPIYDQSGIERGQIAKKWGKLLSEVFTDADTFLIDFSNGSWTAEQRAAILAAAVSVDFDFFENNGGVRGIFEFLPG